MTTKKVCVVVGVGPGNGAALGRRFAKEGYAVALLARSTETIEPALITRSPGMPWTTSESMEMQVLAGNALGPLPYRPPPR